MSRRTPRTLRQSRTTLTAALLSLACAGSLTACVGTDPSEVVHVYSARQYDLEQAFDDFQDETGLEVEFLFGSDAELRERIAAEGEDTEADVYITVDAGNLAAAADQGVFAEIDSPALEEAVPANLRDAQGRWFALAKRTRTIVYSPERVDPAELSTYEDLADPRWSGRLCLRTADSSYTQSLVASMIAERGEEETREIVSGWAENAEIFSNDVEILENIASGQCDVAITNHYYLARELRDDPDMPVALHWADQGVGGVHVNISGGGVTAEADNPTGAQQLVEWLADQGQAELVGDNMEYPVNEQVTPEDILQDFGPFEEQAIDASAYAELNPEAVSLLALAGYR